MCGIVEYVGGKVAESYLLDGLRRLEYRGYDSAGVASIESNQILVTRAVGRIEQLTKRLAEESHHGQIGIGHTRWATHGPATEENAHPHVGSQRRVAVVHNGVIENYELLKAELEQLVTCNPAIAVRIIRSMAGRIAGGPPRVRP